MQRFVKVNEFAKIRCMLQHLILITLIATVRWHNREAKDKQCDTT